MKIAILWLTSLIFCTSSLANSFQLEMERKAEKFEQDVALAFSWVLDHGWHFLFLFLFCFFGVIVVNQLSFIHDSLKDLIKKVEKSQEMYRDRSGIDK